MKINLPLQYLIMNEDSEDEENDDKIWKIMLLLTHSNQWEDHSFWAKMTAEGRRRRDRHLSREALLDPEESPWQRLYNNGSDKDLITFTGFDRNTFDSLLELFGPAFDTHTPYINSAPDGSSYKHIPLKQRGRKRLVKAHACLGLTLSWYRFRRGEYILQGWFGFTSMHLNIWRWFGRRILLKILCNHPDAMVRFPTDEEIATQIEIVTLRHKLLKNVYCTMDGLKLKFQASTNLTEQSMYYNGWQHGHYITNLIVFSACGRIIACVLNVLGSVHDSMLAEWGGIYDKLEETYERTGVRIAY